MVVFSDKDVLHPAPKTNILLGILANPFSAPLQLITENRGPRSVWLATKWHVEVVTKVPGGFEPVEAGDGSGRSNLAS